VMKKAMALPRLVMRIAGYFSAYGGRMHLLHVRDGNSGLATEGCLPQAGTENTKERRERD
jgi:hypothetical protein